MKLVPFKTQVRIVHDYPFHTWSSKTEWRNGVTGWSLVATAVSTEADHITSSRL